MFSIKNILRSSYEFYLSKFIILIGITAVVYFLSVLFEYVVNSIFSVSPILGIIIGVVAGAYSSIFLAAPLLVLVDKWRGNRQK